MLFERLAANVGEFDVSDEDNCTLELKAIRDAFHAQHTAIAVPADITLAVRVQRRLEEVETELVVEDVVSIVKHDHVLFAAVFVQFGVKAQRAQTALDNLILGIAVCKLIKQVVFAEHFFNAKALANARRARHNHCTDIAALDSNGHLTQDFKTCLETFDDVFISFHCNLRFARFDCFGIELDDFNFACFCHCVCSLLSMCCL